MIEGRERGRRRRRKISLWEKGIAGTYDRMASKSIYLLCHCALMG
jgi:hypothetical protein